MADTHFSGPVYSTNGFVSDSLQVGSTSGTPITQIKVYSVTFDPASIAANTVAEQTVTVTGVTTADKVMVNPPSLTAGSGIVGVRVTAADTVGIRFINATASPIDNASGSYGFIAIRS